MISVKDIDVAKKHVMVRCGLDVPLDPKKGLTDPARVLDDTRMMDVVSTIIYLIDKNAKIILAAGWAGRPKGEDPDCSLAPVAKKLEEILKKKKKLKHEVLIAPNCFKDKKPRSVYKNKEEVKQIVKGLKEGQIVVLENVRYDAEANGNDKDFADFFASLADIYVNENEAQNHRAEATTVQTPLIIAKKGGKVVYGLKYLEVIDKIGNLKKKLEMQKRGAFVFGLSGKKIESDPGITSKITVAEELLKTMRKGDSILIGGGVTYTFLLADYFSKQIEKNSDKVKKIVESHNKRILKEASSTKDKELVAKITQELQKSKSEELKKLIGITDEKIKSLIGNSYIRWGQEGEQIVFAFDVIKEAKAKGVSIINAVDHVIANNTPDKSGNLKKEALIKVHESSLNIPSGWSGVAEGPSTLKKMKSAIETAHIYLQSGPFSIEDERVEKISKTDSEIFKAAKKCKDKGGITIGAGGDTVARINLKKAHNSFSVISSAGGATLELLQTGTSKGKEAVEEAQKIMGLK